MKGFKVTRKSIPISCMCLSIQLKAVVLIEHKGEGLN